MSTRTYTVVITDEQTGEIVFAENAIDGAQREKIEDLIEEAMQQ